MRRIKVGEEIYNVPELIFGPGAAVVLFKVLISTKIYIYLRGEHNNTTAIFELLWDYSGILESYKCYVGYVSVDSEYNAIVNWAVNIK